MESSPEKYKDRKNQMADNYQIYINPSIKASNTDSIQEEPEGCLSVPGVNAEIVRFDKIKVRYQSIAGDVIKKPLKGFISKLFQHELDHLDGVLMFDLAAENRLFGVSPNEGLINNKKLKTLILEYYSIYHKNLSI